MAQGKKPKTPNNETVNKAEQQPLALDLDERRHRLEEALIKKGAFKKTEPEKKVPSNNYAVKLSSEFLAAIVVGVILGLGFDRLLSTNPWGLVVFLFLGFAAGVMNVLRSAGIMDENSIGQHDKKK